MQQRITERRAQRLGDERTSAMPADQQPLGRELLNRFAQRRPRNTKAFSQGALRGQTLTRLECALENHGFQLRDDIVR